MMATEYQPVSVSVNPDCMTAAIALSSGFVHVVHLRTLKTIASLSYESSIECVGYDKSMSPPLLLIGGLECGLRIVSLIAAPGAHHLDSSSCSERGSVSLPGGVTSWALMGDRPTQQGLLVLGGLSGRVTLVDVRQGCVKFRFWLGENTAESGPDFQKSESEIGNNAVYALAVGADCIVAASDDGYLRVLPLSVVY